MSVGGLMHYEINWVYEPLELQPHKLIGYMINLYTDLLRHNLWTLCINWTVDI